MQKIDIVTEVLKRQNLDWTSVPEAGRVVRLHVIPNLSQGGSVSYMTDMVHPDNRKMAERAAACMGLKIAGIDFLTPDITRPYWQVGGGICEVNVNADIGMMVAADDDDMLRYFRQAFEVSFPQDQKASIPVIVVLGTSLNAAPAIADLLARQYHTVGHYSEHETTIGGCPTAAGLNPLKACQSVLWNGIADAVLIEENLNRVEKYGLGYRQCDILLVEEMPKRNGQAVPELLELLIKTVTGSILLNGADTELTHWAAGAGDDRIVLITAGKAGDVGTSMASRALAEIE